jgi:threonine dehydrogenase-like Zn-dependent dehydrogenase
LISSGTELKIFKGDFENDAALDVNIEDMEGERMAYPLSYGYSLVGQVVECGSDVDPYFQNKLVFTFSPHATHVVTDVNAVQIVPDGIDAQDAIFMPSVETALSLVHDAHVRLGENVAVYGQGLIGLLVTALLGLQSRALPRTGSYGIVTTFDTIADRLAISADLGASEALFPGGSKGPFDVSIEVSGNGKALQAAIDNTRDGGRIIVGSWYGNSDVQLKLGIDFHRSHKSIQTSQVSEIPALLSRLWSKSRRFSLTWELVKEIRPSRLLTKILPLDQAQTAYETLDLGNEIAVAFDYTNSP